MKLIHIENKIDPADVVTVMREAKEDFARELLVCFRAQIGPIYPDQLKNLMADLLKVTPNIL